MKTKTKTLADKLLQNTQFTEMLKKETLKIVCSHVRESIYNNDKLSNKILEEVMTAHWKYQSKKDNLLRRMLHIMPEVCKSPWPFVSQEEWSNLIKPASNVLQIKTVKFIKDHNDDFILFYADYYFKELCEVVLAAQPKPDTVKDIITVVAKYFFIEFYEDKKETYNRVIKEAKKVSEDQSLLDLAENAIFA